MRGCLFVLAAGAAALALVVLVGLPAAAAGVLTAGVTAAGLEAEDTTVTVTSDPPTDLIGLRADRVRLRASEARFRDLRIGRLDLEFGDVRLLDRTAATVSGELRDVTVVAEGARDLRLASIRLEGGGARVTATTELAGAEVEAMLADAAAAELGVRPASVRLVAPDRLLVEARVRVEGRLEVGPGGDLGVRVRDGPLAGTRIVLLPAGGGLPLRITSARITEAGDLRLRGDLAIGLPFG